MFFRFFTDTISHGSRSLAWGILSAALALMGFAVLIVAFPRAFAFLAAMVFFLAGLGLGATAFKIFWAQRQMDKLADDDDESHAYRDNVRIHRDEPLDPW